MATRTRRRRRALPLGIKLDFRPDAGGQMKPDEKVIAVTDVRPAPPLNPFAARRTRGVLLRK